MNNMLFNIINKE